ncbi:MAG: hypothetical protein KGD59_10160 [Candidatus Heimdallarchaeota archaeon]|nr:hypothetical protein [Candidatus Heimdallarchaeota archaeon]MBY8994901.1 hypothetical protein [Candidatus Heimdallarchaeota archaeon]
MVEIFLHCDSPCFSCPVLNRIIKVSRFSERKLSNSYYCDHCDVYSLCKMGLAYSKFREKELRPTCTKCGRFVDKIELSYIEGQGLRPFSGSSLLFIRRPNGEKFDILQTVKGSYFKDLSEVLLYILYALGPERYNIVNYDTLTKNYNSIFIGNIVVENIAIKSDTPTTTSPQINFD